MAKGNSAKELVIRKIRETFQDDFVGSDGKKIYVWSSEDGEPMQVAISLTCPKIPYAIEAVPAGAVEIQNGFDWSMDDTAPAKVNEITQEEKDNIARLMKKLELE